jgi:multimeric flavodoxin WrbA
MKVLLVNGSPRAAGCTDYALREAERTLRAEGLDTGYFHIGTKPLRGCAACGQCRKGGGCVFGDDAVKPLQDMAAGSDAFIFGSPVYYASANGALIALMDRAFYSGSRHFAYKPAASLVSARRAGTTSAIDQINKYFSISNMPIVSSQYWPMVHGATPEDVARDEEGLQTVRLLARNMAWLLKCLEAGRKAGIGAPEPEKRLWTNFIR